MSTKNVIDLVVEATAGTIDYSSKQIKQYRLVNKEIKSFMRPVAEFFQPYVDKGIIHRWNCSAYGNHVSLTIPWSMEALLNLDKILKSYGFRLINVPIRDSEKLSQIYTWENQELKNQGKCLYAFWITLLAKEGETSDLQQCKVKVIKEWQETVTKKEYEIICNEMEDWEREIMG